MLEEHVDTGMEGTYDSLTQNVWGLRYIDELVLRRTNANWNGGTDSDFTDSTDTQWEQYLHDHQFSVVAGVNRVGTLTFRVAYDAYGEARHSWARDIDGDGDVDSGDYNIANAARTKEIHETGQGSDRRSPEGQRPSRNAGSQGDEATLYPTRYSEPKSTPRAGVPARSTPGDPPVRALNADADWNRDGEVTSTDVAAFGSTHHAGAIPAGLVAPRTSELTVGFCGYRFNPEIGAYTVRFRHYDPTPGVARWLERDPAGYVDGPSLYGYLGRSPVDGMDPSGLASGYFTWENYRWGWDAVDTYGHDALDAAGMIPGLGALADGINALWYAAEGDWENFAWSAGAILIDGLTVVKRSGWITASIAMPNGVGVMIGKRIPKAAKPGVVIREGMDRVKDYAAEHGLETIKDWMQRNGIEVWSVDINDRWVREMMEEGRTFHDIGPFWKRRHEAEEADKVWHGPKWRR